MYVSAKGSGEWVKGGITWSTCYGLHLQRVIEECIRSLEQSRYVCVTQKVVVGEGGRKGMREEGGWVGLPG